MRNSRAASRPEARGWAPLTAFLSIFWVLAGLFEATWYETLTSFGGAPSHWGFSFLFAQGFWGVAAIFTPMLVWIDRSLSLERGRRVRSIVLHVPALLAFGIVHITVRNLWIRVLTGHTIPFPEFLRTVPGLISSQLGSSLAVYAGVLAAVHGWSYYLRYGERARAASALELDQAELRASLSEARLMALQAQLQPHFLFNALHAVSTLVLDDDKQGATSAISHLSRFLRLTLDHGASPLVPLSVELQFLEAYVEVQRIRFGDRLRVSLRIDEAARAAAVPTLLLQPLIENSIKYGIDSGTGAGGISVRASVCDGRLHLEVEDDGTGPSGSLEPGHGLSNVRARLQQLFPGAHEFRLSASPQGGARAAVTIPFRPLAPEPAEAAGGLDQGRRVDGSDPSPDRR